MGGFGGMINLIRIILIKILGLFPDSPFTELALEADVIYIQYLNWFLPLDTCLNLMLVWVDCMLLLLVLKMLFKLLWDVLISKLMTFVPFLG